jgi:hypothetical protein
MSAVEPIHVRSEHGEGPISPAKAFSAGLKQELRENQNGWPKRGEPVIDERVMNLVDEIKARVMLLAGIGDPDYDEPKGLRFIALHLKEGCSITAGQIVAGLRQHPHLDQDHLLRVAQDPRTNDWLICVQPRNRMTRFGVEYWLRNDALEQDRSALKGICLDLRNTAHNLRVWMSTEPLSPVDQSKIHDIFHELQGEIPEYTGTGTRLDLRVPLEAQGDLPRSIRLKEDYVILGPIVDPIPRSQEDRELEDIQRKLATLKRGVDGMERRVTVMIYRHALTIRVINALNRLRLDPDNAALLHIMARPDIREQYPQLFEIIDTRRKIEKVAVEDLPQPLPKRTRQPERKSSWWAGTPAPLEKRPEPVAEGEAHRRVDPDMVRVVKEVRRAERAERAKKSWGGWLGGMMGGKRKK